MGKLFGSAIDLPVVSAHPATPASGSISIYGLTDGKIYQKDSAGAVTPLTTTFGSFFPPGVMMPYAAPIASLPAGWLECDGSVLNQTTYPSLASTIQGTFNNVGETYPTVCRLPDVRRRYLRGADPAAAPSSVHGQAGDDGYETDTSLRTLNHKHPLSSNGTAGTSGSGHAHPIPQVGHQLVSNTATGGTAARIYQIGGSGDTNHDHGGNAGSSGSAHVHNSLAGTSDNSVTGDIPFVNTRYIIYAG